MFKFLSIAALIFAFTAPTAAHARAIHSVDESRNLSDLLTLLEHTAQGDGAIHSFRFAENEDLPADSGHCAQVTSQKVVKEFDRVASEILAGSDKPDYYPLAIKDLRRILGKYRYFECRQIASQGADPVQRVYFVAIDHPYSLLLELGVEAEQ